MKWQTTTKEKNESKIDSQNLIYNDAAQAELQKKKSAK
jgi:hypothetical protein